MKDPPAFKKVLILIMPPQNSVQLHKMTHLSVILHLNHYLLDRAALLLHQNPLSIDVILGYMFAKEVEIRNLKTLIKGRQLGLDEDFINRELIVH